MRTAPGERRREQPAPGASPHDRSAVAAGVVIAVLLGGALPLLIAAHYHALGIPRSDDWSYLVTEFRWVDGGGLSFNHWVSMSLVGQLVVAAPVARLWPRDVTALQITTTVAGTLGLLAVLGTARRAGVASRPAVLLTATVAAGPLWAPLAASFMTDVPAFAAAAAAGYFAVRHLRGDHGSAWELWVAIGLAALGFSIRQYGAVTLVAVVATGWLAARGRPDRRRAIGVVAAVAVLAAIAFQLWWSSVPDVRALSPTTPDAHAVGVLVSKGAGFVRLAGLSLLPVLLAVHPIRRLRAAADRAPARMILVAGGTSAWLAVAAARSASDLFVGNYLVHDGVLSDIVLIGRRADVLPSALWALVAVVASAAGVVLVVLAVEGLAAARRGSLATADPLTLLFALTLLGYGGAFVLAMLTGVQVYDRYVLPLLPAAGLLLLRAEAPAIASAPDAPPRPARVGAGAVVALVALALLGLAFATDSASFDGARWKVAEAAVARGWRPREVNGGFEWRNFHRGRKLAAGQRGAGERICVTVHVDPHVPAGRIVAVVRSTAPTRRSMRLVAYRTHVACPVPGTP